MENYCLYCNNRNCDCLTIENDIINECINCGQRSCKLNPLTCKIKGLNMEYYKNHLKEFLKDIVKIQLNKNQEQLLDNFLNQQ